jgi:hypothetical protein
MNRERRTERARIYISFNYSPPRFPFPFSPSLLLSINSKVENKRKLEHGIGSHMRDCGDMKRKKERIGV